jgi:ABC-type polar amino acid transport system ATPase subunit
MIRVAGLDKRFDGHAVLRGICFELPAGAVGAVIGASGAGKTTLLRCLVGLEPFDAGTIRVDDVEISAESTHAGRRALKRALARLRGRVGLVFQAFELFPHLTVLENCALAPMKVRGVSRVEAEARATALLARLSLGDKLREYPERLSGGQRQRVAIARALAMEPRVLLYDEPTSALDRSLRREVQATVRRVQETGVTQILVTHDVAFARDAADQVLVLDAGELVESGPSATVLDSPRTEVTRRLLREEPAAG